MGKIQRLPPGGRLISFRSPSEVVVQKKRADTESNPYRLFVALQGIFILYSHSVKGRNEAFLGGFAALKKAVSDPDLLREFHDLFVLVGRELA